MKVILNLNDVSDDAYQNKWRKGIPLTLDDFYISKHTIKNADTIVFDTGGKEIILKKPGK